MNGRPSTLMSIPAGGAAQGPHMLLVQHGQQCPGLLAPLALNDLVTAALFDQVAAETRLLQQMATRNEGARNLSQSSSLSSLIQSFIELGQLHH